jgi:hypothetical protein
VVVVVVGLVTVLVEVSVECFVIVTVFVTVTVLCNPSFTAFGPSEGVSVVVGQQPTPAGQVVAVMVAVLVVVSDTAVVTGGP